METMSWPGLQHRVGGGIVGLIARPMAPCVNEDEPIVLLQGGDIAHLIPTLQAIGKPVLEHEWWSFTFHLIMETDAVVIGIWHSRDLPLHTLAWKHALLTPEAQNPELNHCYQIILP